MSTIPTANGLSVGKSCLDLDFWGYGASDRSTSTTAESKDGYLPSENEDQRLSDSNGETTSSKCFTREFQSSLFQLVGGGFDDDFTRKFSAGVQQRQECSDAEELIDRAGGKVRSEEDANSCSGVIGNQGGGDDFKTHLQEDRVKEIKLIRRISGNAVALRERLDEIVCQGTEERNRVESSYEQEREAIQRQFMDDQKQITDLYEQRQLLRQNRLKDRTNEDYITTLRQELSSSLATPGGGSASDPIAEATRRRLTFLDVHADQVIEVQRRRLEELRTKAALDAHLSWDRRHMTSSSSSFDSPENGRLDPGRENQPSISGVTSEERHPGVVQIPTESRTSSSPPPCPPPRPPPRSLQSSDPIHVENGSESPSEDSGQSNSEQMSNISSASNDNEDQRVAEMTRQLEAAQAEKRLLLQAHMRQTIVLEELRSEKQKRLELEERLQEEIAKRSVDQGQVVSLRQDTIRQARPLTRYLPVRNGEIDLPEFLEQCGHAFELCPHLSVSSRSARGQLTKMGQRIKSWRRRWFVFDRTQRHLAYYVDRTERKRKGSIPFGAIEDVYVGGGHLGGCGGVKSPSPSLTFCVKTKARTYHIVAPSNESMRIWIDVIFTGAEGYQEFV